MSETQQPESPQYVPTFVECVIGYRAWHADTRHRLWPLHSARRPWQPGINVARCSCRTLSSLRFECRWHHGRRILEAEPAHPAPDPHCACGLYSWRRPRSSWYQPPKPGAPLLVVGAVASWGRLQVHKDGFRAEHSCVVTLAYHPDAPPGGLDQLQRIAARYRVDLVRLDELEQAASRHGTPLPDRLMPQSPMPPPEAESHPEPEIAPAPDATVEEVGTAPPRIGFDGMPLPGPDFVSAGRLY